MKKIILTGDRPTGRLHVGHYVGSLKERVRLQNSGAVSYTHLDVYKRQITNNGGTIGGGAILDKPEPDPEQPGAGSEDGGTGAVIAALAVGTAVVGGGILLAHSYIQNNLRCV